MIKKVTKKTVQITKPELAKCRANKEFKVGVVTYVKPKPPIVETDDTDEPIIHGDPYDRNLPPPQPKPPRGMPPWFKTWSYTFETNNNSRFDRIETRLSNLETSVSKLDTKLTRVIKLNKLKS